MRRHGKASALETLERPEARRICCRPPCPDPTRTNGWSRLYVKVSLNVLTCGGTAARGQVPGADLAGCFKDS